MRMERGTHPTKPQCRCRYCYPSDVARMECSEIRGLVGVAEACPEPVEGFPRIPLHSIRATPAGENVGCAMRTNDNGAWNAPYKPEMPLWGGYGPPRHGHPAVICMLIPSVFHCCTSSCNAASVSGFFDSQSASSDRWNLVPLKRPCNTGRALSLRLR